jgi:translation initiation factor 1 (eIF-1/SUI1)
MSETQTERPASKPSEQELNVSELDQVSGGKVSAYHLQNGASMLAQHCATGEHIKEAKLTV